jgi:hypothetical protein
MLSECYEHGLEQELISLVAKSDYCRCFCLQEFMCLEENVIDH